jgi:DNA-binding CsgD family transcriptional regulator
MRPVALPAGLEDNSLEIYLHNKALHAIYQGKVIPFSELPEEIKDIFAQNMLSNKTAFKSLQNDFHLADAGEMLEQFVKCNFGNFDCIPDMDEDSTIYPECWNCGRRGACPGEGKICSRIQGKNGMLSRRETEIFFLIIDGKQDKEIADHFNTTISTIKTQLSDIREKLGVNNRIEIMDFALKSKILSI